MTNPDPNQYLPMIYQDLNQTGLDQCLVESVAPVINMNLDKTTTISFNVNQHIFPAWKKIEIIIREDEQPRWGASLIRADEHSDPSAPNPPVYQNLYNALAPLTVILQNG